MRRNTMVNWVGLICGCFYGLGSLPVLAGDADRVAGFAQSGEAAPGETANGVRPVAQGGAAQIAPSLAQIKATPIRVWNRKEGREEEERIYGAALLNWVYGTKLGQTLADSVLSQAWLSQLYGFYQSSFLSEFKIARFVKHFEIPMQDFIGAPYSSFNQFFIRKFRPGLREFVKAPSEMGAFAEARYLAYEHFQAEHTLSVKGKVLTIEALLGGPELAQEFLGGPVLVARLAPIDYHRFHFPDDGKMVNAYSLRGNLQSVNPVALKYKGDILATNERQVTILETKNFGKIAYVEVGALCVGKIVQTHLTVPEFHKGEEKGYFLFGASTVIVLGQPGKWRPDTDLLAHTLRGQETLVQLGTRVAYTQ